MSGTMKTAKEINNLKVADLREELRSYGLKVSGVKQDLVTRLVNHLKASKSQSSARIAAPPNSTTKATASTQMTQQVMSPVPVSSNVASDKPVTSVVPADATVSKPLELQPCLTSRIRTEESETAIISHALERCIRDSWTEDTPVTSEVQAEVAVELQPCLTSSVRMEESETASISRELETPTPPDATCQTSAGALQPDTVMKESETKTLVEREFVEDTPASRHTSESFAETQEASLSPTTQEAETKTLVERVFAEDFPASLHTSEAFPQTEEAAAVAEVATLSPTTQELQTTASVLNAAEVSAGVLLTAINKTDSIDHEEELLTHVSHQTGALVDGLAAHEVLACAPEQAQTEGSRMQDGNALQGAVQQQARVHTAQRPPKRARRVSRVPLSPTALLAPEVGGTPCKDDASPVKSAQKAWRDLCAKEAARLRLDGSSAEREASPDDPSDSTGGDADYEASCPRSPDSSQSSDSSGSPDLQEACGRSPLSRSRSLSQEPDAAKRPKLVLRKRRSVLERESRAGRESTSRSRSPIRRLGAAPRNCLFQIASQRTADLTHVTAVTATPEVLRARARAVELRAELLERRANTLPSPATTPPPPPAEVAPSPRNLSWSLQDAAGTASSNKEQQMQILEKLTQQMQVVIARLQDQQLDDSRREKYQALALSIQSQVDKINIRFRSSQAVTRGGC